MDPGFTQAKADNLPKVDSAMMATYFKNSSNFYNTEIKGVKSER